MLSNVYEYDGVITTVQRHCELLGLAPKIAVWRLSKGKSVKEVFAPVPNPITWNGEIWTAAMLAEYVGLDDTLIRLRWAEGKRGVDLVVRPPEERREAAKKEELKEKNREFLRLLLRYHRRRGIEYLKNRTSDCIEEPFDYAAAQINAQRFLEAARENTITSTGFSWEYAA